jgi:hypothetical protein
VHQRTPQTTAKKPRERGPDSQKDQHTALEDARGALPPHAHYAKGQKAPGDQSSAACISHSSPWFVLLLSLRADLGLGCATATATKKRSKPCPHSAQCAHATNHNAEPARKRRPRQARQKPLAPHLEGERLRHGWAIQSVGLFPWIANPLTRNAFLHDRHFH